MKAKIEEKFVMTRQSKKGVEKEAHPSIYFLPKNHNLSLVTTFLCVRPVKVFLLAFHSTEL